MSRSEPTRRLRVISEDAGVQITVLNQMLETVAHGVQSLERDLPLGLYEARFEAGSSVREQLISLQPGSGALDIHQPLIAFPSSAPLAHTQAELPEQSRAAARVSRRVDREIGRGGQLLIFIRDEDRRARSNPARGLTLHDPAGELVGEIESDGTATGPDRNLPPWAACNYRLRPGSWRLRSRAPGAGVLEQSVVVSPKWQTQVFLQRRRSPSGEARCADLADASVLMAETDQGFKPELAELRATELARQGLRDRRVVISAAELNAMLYGKRKNPMLAIYGAHLMIHAEDPDRQFLAKVTKNLRGLVGDHPDVMALCLWLDPDADVGDFAEPPMLLSSWSIIVTASAERPELVPRGSLSAAISERVLAGGPWLRWRLPPRSAAAEGGGAPSGQLPLGEAIAALADALPKDPRPLCEEAAEHSASQSQVISFATQLGEHASRASDAEIVERFGVPRSVAEDAISAVAARLEE